MELSALLDQVIRSGKELVETAEAKGRDLASSGNAAFEDFAQEKLGIEADSEASSVAKGAAAAAALLVLFGTRGGRAVTGSALRLGSLAALGGLAYKTFQDWQAQQGGDTSAAAGLPVGELTGDAAEARARQLLLAMVTAANVDTRISHAERDRIGERLRQIDPSADVETFISSALTSPASIEALVGPVDSPTYAAEMYLAAASVLNSDRSGDREWLDDLGVALKLDPQLAADLLRGLE